MQEKNLPCFGFLENSVQYYAWGDAQSILDYINPKVLQDATNKVKGENPIAEVWMGTHELAPSKLLIGNTATSLRDHIENAPQHWLGPRIAQEFGELPFLFKVLSAKSPLSLQLHPNSEQARAGFAAEEAAKVPRTAPIRTFKDPHHKPELAVALTPFLALAGFRSPSEIAELLGKDICALLDFQGTHQEELRTLMKNLFSLRTGQFEPCATAEKANQSFALTVSQERQPTIIFF